MYAYSNNSYNYKLIKPMHTIYLLEANPVI